jgi:hypothetical protein
MVAREIWRAALRAMIGVTKRNSASLGALAFVINRGAQIKAVAATELMRLSAGNPTPHLGSPKSI